MLGERTEAKSPLKDVPDAMRGVSYSQMGPWTLLSNQMRGGFRLRWPLYGFHL